LISNIGVPLLNRNGDALLGVDSCVAYLRLFQVQRNEIGLFAGFKAEAGLCLGLQFKIQLEHIFHPFVI
jgi:hypothetical protein